MFVDFGQSGKIIKTVVDLVRIGYGLELLIAKYAPHLATETLIQTVIIIYKQETAVSQIEPQRLDFPFLKAESHHVRRCRASGTGTTPDP